MAAAKCISCCLLQNHVSLVKSTISGGLKSPRSAHIWVNQLNGYPDSFVVSSFNLLLWMGIHIGTCSNQSLFCKISDVGHDLAVASWKLNSPFAPAFMGVVRGFQVTISPNAPLWRNGQNLNNTCHLLICHHSIRNSNRFLPNLWSSGGFGTWRGWQEIDWLLQAVYEPPHQKDP